MTLFGIDGAADMRKPFSFPKCRASINEVNTSAMLAVGTLVLLVSALSSCHSGDAGNGCDAMAQELYKARQMGAREQVAKVLSSTFLPPDDRNALLLKIIDRDRTCGLQKSRRRYLTNASLQRSGFPDEHYDVRTGYALVYPHGDTWEEVVCRTDPLGQHAAIVDVVFGPLRSIQPAK
jgi:hypothetical protein